MPTPRWPTLRARRCRRRRDSAALFAHDRLVRRHHHTRQLLHEIRERRELLVLHPDGRQSAARDLRVARGHGRDRLTLVAHDVAGEDRLVRVLETVGRPAGDVGGGEHGSDTVHRPRGGGVDRADPRGRVGAAQRAAPEHPGCVQVAGERERAGDLRDAVGTVGGCAHAVHDPGRAGGRDGPVAAHRPASSALGVAASSRNRKSPPRSANAVTRALPETSSAANREFGSGKAWSQGSSNLKVH